MYIYYWYATKVYVYVYLLLVRDTQTLSPRPLIIATHMHTCAANIWKPEIRARYNYSNPAAD